MAEAATVDEYLAALPEDARAAMTTLRGAIRAAAPGATETISYHMPAFEVDGRLLVSYGAFKRHCSLFPASQVVRDALGAELEPYFTGQGTVRFPAARPIPVRLVERIVKARLEESATRSRR